VFITNHALAGATLGLLTRRPAVAFATGMASHVAMDMVLHWGDERLDWDGFVEVAKVDGTLGLAVCAALLAVAPVPTRPAVAAGIAGACLIDLDKPARHFLGRSPFPPVVDRLHARIQRQRPTGLLVEAAAAAGLVALLGPLHRRRLRQQHRPGVSRGAGSGVGGAAPASRHPR
jgi:hypothetical protein